MACPFPGMDPFVESQIWEDFYGDIIPVIRAQIIPQVRPRYTVRIERSVFLTCDEEAESFRQDVMIAESVRATESAENALATVTLEPRILAVPEPYQVAQKFLTIRTRDDRRVVTVIELLSPTNKDDKEGQAQYLGKDRQNNKCRIWFDGTRRGRESFSGNDQPHGERLARKRLPTPSAMARH